MDGKKQQEEDGSPEAEGAETAVDVAVDEGSSDEEESACIEDTPPDSGDVCMEDDPGNNEEETTSSGSDEELRLSNEGGDECNAKLPARTIKMGTDDATHTGKDGKDKEKFGVTARVAPPGAVPDPPGRKYPDTIVGTGGEFDSDVVRKKGCETEKASTSCGGLAKGLIAPGAMPEIVQFEEPQLQPSRQVAETQNISDRRGPSKGRPCCIKEASKPVIRGAVMEDVLPRTAEVGNVGAFRSAGPKAGKTHMVKGGSKGLKADAVPEMVSMGEPRPAGARHATLQTDGDHQSPRYDVVRGPAPDTAPEIVLSHDEPIPPGMQFVTQSHNLSPGDSRLPCAVPEIMPVGEPRPAGAWNVTLQTSDNNQNSFNQGAEGLTPDAAPEIVVSHDEPILPGMQFASHSHHIVPSDSRIRSLEDGVRDEAPATGLRPAEDSMTERHSNEASLSEQIRDQTSLPERRGWGEAVNDVSGALSAFVAPDRTRTRAERIRAAVLATAGDTVYEGVPIREKNFLNRHRWTILMGLVILIVAGIVGAVLGTLGRESEDRLTSLAVSISGSKAHDASTPQGQALRWLLGTDGYQFPPKDGKIKQRYILATLYYALNGSNWTKNGGFLSASDECSGWFGIHCWGNHAGPNSGRIKSIHLNDNNMRGELPPEITHFTALLMLDMKENWISGAIPSDVGNMTALEKLSLSGNPLRDIIPRSIGDLGNLEELSVGIADIEGDEYGYSAAENNPKLAGTIPTTIGKLKKLQWISLSGNKLSGQIPSEIGALPELKTMHLYGNLLSGPVPSEIGLLASIETMRLSSNRLSGTLHTELGMLGNLVVLNMHGAEDSNGHGNNLTGPIPSELGKLSKLEELYLMRNSLTSSIPREMGNLESLIELSLTTNALTGPIPSELGKLAKLEWLFLYKNMLTSSIPSEMGNLESLVRLDLSSNALTGPIPSELGKMSRLAVLYFFNNSLNFRIPTEMGNLENLTRLDLRTNALTGPVSSELGTLSKLEDLRLYDNMLTSNIPREIGNLEHLLMLALGTNSLSGPIPSELGTLSKLEDLRLDDNMLTSSIPSEMGNLESLVQLALYTNDLTGPVPSELGTFSKLELLHLWDNRLTSSIPSEIGNLKSLIELGLDVNALTGPIPSELGTLSWLENIWLQSNALTGSVPSEICTLELLVLLEADCLNEIGCSCCTKCY